MKFEVKPQNRIFAKNYLINVAGNAVDTSIPRVMGIINVTPDSFYDGGKNNNETRILCQAEQHLNEGAFCLDIGGCSTRPGADEVSVTKELKRVVPAVEAVKEHFPKAIISVDTFRAKVAAESLKSGAHMINDVSGCSDPDMPGVIQEFQVPYVLMHLAGDINNMHHKPNYEDVTRNVLRFFARKIAYLRSFGIHDIILDPGFGFGKTQRQNLQLIQELERFKLLECPVMAGVSRKSTIQSILDVSADESLNGTVVLNTVALMNGASFLRVHDVKPATEAVQMIHHLQTAKSG